MTDVGTIFDLYCKNHPAQPIDDRARPELLCTTCYLQAWNAGAHQADAHWADERVTPYKDELNPDGRSILKDHQGYYTRRPGE